MDMVIAIIVVLVVAAASFLIFNKTNSEVSKSAQVNINNIVNGAVIWGFASKSENKKKIKNVFRFRAKTSKKPEKKGIVLTTTLLAAIIFVIVVAFVMFLIFASIGGEAPRGANSFFYGVFDAIMRSLPWVS